MDFLVIIWFILKTEALNNFCNSETFESFKEFLICDVMKPHPTDINLNFDFWNENVLSTFCQVIMKAKLTFVLTYTNRVCSHTYKTNSQLPKEKVNCVRISLCR